MMADAPAAKNQNLFCWIEIPVADMDRAEAFYSALLGISMDRKPVNAGMEMSWFPMDSNYGATGALIKMHENSPMKAWYTPSSQGPRVYLTVPGKIADTVAKAEELGVKILMPYMDIGEFGHMAMIEDTEGNYIALHSEIG